MRFDRMNPVAVRAYRRQPVTPADSLPVNTLHESLFDSAMALAAGDGNVELVNRRLCIVGRKNLVRTVAIRAYRGLLRSLLDGQSMHALLVRHKGLTALPVRFHQKLLPVAPAAGGWNVVMIHRRFDVTCSQNLVRASVAVLAVCGRCDPTPGGIGVVTVRISILLIRMALGAGNL